LECHSFPRLNLEFYCIADLLPMSLLHTLSSHCNSEWYVILEFLNLLLYCFSNLFNAWNILVFDLSGYLVHGLFRIFDTLFHKSGVKLIEGIV
jgi:hypothetical protein